MAGFYVQGGDEMSDKIKNVVFDMGGVLLDTDKQRALDHFFDSEEEKEIVVREYFHGEEWRDVELGLMTMSERYKRVTKRIPASMHGKLLDFIFGWNMAVYPVHDSMPFFHNYIKGRYDAYVISNANIQFYDYFERYFRMDEFSGVLISSDVHVMKPDPKIFEIFLEQYQLNPSECLFIDDRKENVVAAQSVGMQGCVFDGDFKKIVQKYKL